MVCLFSVSFSLTATLRVAHKVEHLKLRPVVVISLTKFFSKDYFGEK